jgi:hypothetical protein
MKILPVEHIDQVLEIALMPAPAKPKPIRQRKKAPTKENAANGEGKNDQVNGSPPGSGWDSVSIHPNA